MTRTRRNSRITISESVNHSLESARQALEVFYGQQVRVICDTEIELGRVRRIDQHHRSRSIIISFEISVLTEDGGQIKRTVYADLELMKDFRRNQWLDQSWRAMRGSFKIDGRNQPCLSCTAHWEDTDKPHVRRVLIGLDTEEQNRDHQIRVGTSCKDSHSTPITQTVTH